MRAPALVGIVAALHLTGLCFLVLMQGCSSTTLDRRAKIESYEDVPPPPAPPMPAERIAIAPKIELKPLPLKEELVPAVETARTYTLKQGQTLSHVARHFGLGTRQLAAFNGIEKIDVVYAGQKLKIPSYASNLDAGALPVALRSTPPVKTETGGSPLPDGSKYIVQSGDTLSHIGKKFGVTVAAIKDANALASDRILVGQSLVVPTVSGEPEVADLAQDTTDSGPVGTGALPGEDLDSAISDVLVPDDAPAPEGENPSIKPDLAEEASTPAPVDSVLSDQEQPIVYQAQPGDTIDDIAKLFIVSKEELLRINNLVDGQELEPEQPVMIPPSAL